MKMTAKFEAEGESFNACFEQLNSAFNAEFSASGGGRDGKDGATFTPSVSEDGVISWTNDRELPNPAPVNIKGAKGDKGEKGERGLQGIQGIQGIQGVKGDKGDKGDKGADGADGITPVKGIDYFTEEDKAELVEQVLEEIPEGGGVTSWNDLTDKPDFAPVATSGSWNDLTDKPFGETYDWVEKIRGTVSPSISPNANGYYSANVTRPSGFKFVAGEKYKIVATIGLFTKEYEYTATSKNYATYVGTTDDDVYLVDLSPMGGITLYFKASNQTTVVLMVYACGASVKTLDEKFFPDSVVLESELTAKGYQTEKQVTALINNALGVIENGTY